VEVKHATLCVKRWSRCFPTLAP